MNFWKHENVSVSWHKSLRGDKKTKGSSSYNVTIYQEFYQGKELTLKIYILFVHAKQIMQFMKCHWKLAELYICWQWAKHVKITFTFQDDDFFLGEMILWFQ